MRQVCGSVPENGNGCIIDVSNRVPYVLKSSDMAIRFNDFLALS